MTNELGLIVFAFVGTVSPGPNNAVLWASGLRFGFRPTVPHLVGTAIGMGSIILAVAAGIGAALHAVPGAETALKVVGSLYLVYIAYLVVRGGTVNRADVAAPLTVWQAVWFQCLNPKAWVFSVAAVAAFLPEGKPVAVVTFTAVVLAVVVVSSSIWAAGGVALGLVLDDERSRRAVSITLAALLVASVALIWIDG
ncbi:MAG: LysE family translocator [Actinomycetota bacterium]